jgi:hypothetical protein
MLWSICKTISRITGKSAYLGVWGCSSTDPWITAEMWVLNYVLELGWIPGEWSSPAQPFLYLASVFPVQPLLGVGKYGTLAETFTSSAFEWPLSLLSQNGSDLLSILLTLHPYSVSTKFQDLICIKIKETE